MAWLAVSVPINNSEQLTTQLPATDTSSSLCSPVTSLPASTDAGLAELAVHCTRYQNPGVTFKVFIAMYFNVLLTKFIF